MTRVHVWNPEELTFAYLLDGVAYMPCLVEDIERYKELWEREGYEAAFALSDKEEPQRDRRCFRTDFPTSIWADEQLLQIAEREFGFEPIDEVK